MSAFTVSVFVLFILIPVALLAIHIGCRWSAMFRLRVYAAACRLFGIKATYVVRERRHNYKRTEYRGRTLNSSEEVEEAIHVYRMLSDEDRRNESYAYIGAEVVFDGKAISWPLEKEAVDERQSPLFSGVSGSSGDGPGDTLSGEAQSAAQAQSGEDAGVGSGPGQDHGRVSLSALMESSTQRGDHGVAGPAEPRS